MRKLFRWCAVACAVLGAPGLATAQNPASYPDRPIRLVVAFVAGGATDTLARQISNDLKEALGQTIVVENRPGANGYLAWNHVASSEPDGYTLLLAENALAISQALHKKATSSFDPLTQYDAVAAVATAPSALVLAKNVPANSVAELVALFAHRAAEDELRLRRRRQRLAPELRGVQGRGRHRGRPHSLQGRRPGDRRRARRPRPDDDIVGAGHQGPGRRRQDQGAGGDQLDAVSGHAERADHDGGRREARRRGAALLVRHLRPEGHAGRRQGQARKGRRDRDVRSSACASAWPSSTSRRTSRPAPRCGPSSKARSRTGPSSSTRKASSRNERRIRPHRQRQVRSRRERCDHAAAVGAARGARAARQPVRLRHRAMRRLHGADRRRAGLFAARARWRPSPARPSPPSKDCRATAHCTRCSRPSSTSRPASAAIASRASWCRRRRCSRATQRRPAPRSSTALDPHLCRCGMHNRVIRAVERAAATIRASA